MHELSLVMEVVRRVDAIAKSNNVSEVDTIVLQIGEIATVVPHFVQACCHRRNMDDRHKA